MNIDALRIAAAAFKSALQKEDRPALIDAARRLVELNAPLGGQWQGLAQAVFRWGELTLATRALDLWTAQGGGPLPNYVKASLLARVGKTEEAARIAAALPESAPSPAANAYMQGYLATSLGERDRAETQFRRTIAGDPNSGRAWLGLVQLGRVKPADEAAMKRLALSIGKSGIEDRAALESAFGLLAHQQDRHAEAFAHFTKARQIQRESYSYNPADNEASARIAASWSAADIARLSEPAPTGARQPIFVTGQPRSGTTLVEQILVSHSAVDGGGELGLALQLEATAGGFAPRDIDRYIANGGAIGTLRDLYLRLASERIAGDGAFIDKTLNQSRSIGPLATLFPEAPFIWMRRDPLDNVMSVYRTWLANNTVSAWSLEELAHHRKVEDGLLAHWERELGDRLLVVPYEELVDDPRGWTERITAHCGLAIEEDQFEFHRTARGVTTASALQVREPINRKGIGAAEPYREFLKPFIDAYVGEAAGNA